MREEERELIAYHEAGHVLCAELSAEHEKAQRATIKPRGQAGGLALYGQTDKAIHSAQYLHECMLCALGGRAAEWVRYGKVSTSAANDLEQVNTIARRAVEELGFSPATGQITLSGARGRVSERTREVIDTEVERIVAEAYAEAVHLLEAHRTQLDALATALLASEDLSRIEIVTALAAADGGELAPRIRPKSLAPRTAPALHRPVPAPRARGGGSSAASGSAVASRPGRRAASRCRSPAVDASRAGAGCRRTKRERVTHPTRDMITDLVDLAANYWSVRLTYRNKRAQCCSRGRRARCSRTAFPTARRCARKRSPRPSYGRSPTNAGSGGWRTCCASRFETDGHLSVAGSQPEARPRG